jgi:DNA-binding transcriptional LysR family regulator
MRSEQIKYFVEAVNRGSINKAAEALYVSQSTVYDALTKLEEEMDAALLNRTHIGVVPTPAGRRFYDWAVDTLERMEDMRASLAAETAAAQKVRIALAMTPEAIDVLVPEFMRRMAASHPDVQVAARLGDFYDCMHMVAEGVHHLDYGLIFVPQAFMDQTRMQAFLAENDLAWKALAQTRIMATVSRHSPLARRSEVGLEELLTYPAVLYKSDLDTSWHRLALATYGSLQLGFISGSWQLCDRYLADHPECFGFSSRAAWPSRQRCLQIPLKETLWEQIILVWRREADMVHTVEEILGQVCDRYIVE